MSTLRSWPTRKTSSSSSRAKLRYLGLNLERSCPESCAITQWLWSYFFQELASPFHLQAVRSTGPLQTPIGCGVGYSVKLWRVWILYSVQPLNKIPNCQSFQSLLLGVDYVGLRTILIRQTWFVPLWLGCPQKKPRNIQWFLGTMRQRCSSQIKNYSNCPLVLQIKSNLFWNIKITCW